MSSWSLPALWFLYLRHCQWYYVSIICRIELAPENIGKNKKIENVAGTLFAYVAKDSLDAGFEGFVVFDSKTLLVEHYVEKYGAQILFGNRLYFDTKASKALIKKYLKGKTNG